MRLMIWAASLPRPFRMTRRGSLRALLALRTMPMAPSAAAKDSWPARKAKHLVSSDSSMAPRLPWPRPTLRSSATEPAMQKACRPTPMASWRPRRRSSRRDFMAMAAPTVYAQTGVFKADGLDALDDLIRGRSPWPCSISRHSSTEPMPYCRRGTPLILSILRFVVFK